MDVRTLLEGVRGETVGATLAVVAPADAGEAGATITDEDVAAMPETAPAEAEEPGITAWPELVDGDPLTMPEEAGEAGGTGCPTLPALRVPLLIPAELAAAPATNWLDDVAVTLVGVT